MGQQRFSDPTLPQQATFDDDLVFVIDDGYLGSTKTINSSIIKTASGFLSDWAAGEFATGQKVIWNNLQLEATTGFTSSTPLTEIAAGSWEVIGGVMNKNYIAANETYVIPKYHTGHSTNLVLAAATSTLVVMADAVLYNYGAVDNSAGGTITGNERLFNKPL